MLTLTLVIFGHRKLGMALRKIELNFDVPPEYQHLFLVEVSLGKQQIVVVKGGEPCLYTGCRGRFSASEINRCLDWMEETMAAIRKDCEK